MRHATERVRDRAAMLRTGDHLVWGGCRFRLVGVPAFRNSAGDFMIRAVADSDGRRVIFELSAEDLVEFDRTTEADL